MRERFRPYIARLLVCHWRGDYVITLGSEAFQWFARYGEPRAFEDFWRREDRYAAEIGCRIEAECAGGPLQKTLVVAPLPHPSPLNQTYWELFPELLQARLERIQLK